MWSSTGRRCGPGKRDDYDYLLGTNTHIVTKAGWFHYQDNLKVVDRGGEPKAIAHETGMNRYKRVESPSAAAAIAWWSEHGLAWDGIRDFWLDALEETEGTFAFRSSAEGMGISKALQELVETKAAAPAIQATLQAYLIQNKTNIEAYGKFHVTHLSEVEDPAKIIVFASARSAKGKPGYFEIRPPRLTKQVWTSGKFDEESPAHQHGFVDFRYNGSAVTVCLAGNVQLLTEKELRDMRRWSNQAARENDPEFTIRRSTE